MKSIFKRTLATATGSVLALSQLLSVANVNISAADTKTLKIDAASILSVPFEETNPLAAHQSSDWADKVESKFIELGSHDFSYSSQKIKNQIAKTLKKNAFAKYMSSEDVDALVAKIDKEVKGHTEPDGSFSASISYDDMGDVTKARLRWDQAQAVAESFDVDPNVIPEEFAAFEAELESAQ